MVFQIFPKNRNELFICFNLNGLIYNYYKLKLSHNYAILAFVFSNSLSMEKLVDENGKSQFKQFRLNISRRAYSKSPRANPIKNRN